MTSINPQIGIAANIQAVIDDFYAKKLALQKSGASGAAASAPDNPADWNAAPPRNIGSFQQATTDQTVDTMQTARPIGNLTGGKTRLNVFSALTDNDRVDFYSFNLTTTGKVGLSSSSDQGVHVQLLNKSGQVIADSEATVGTTADNYKALTATNLYLNNDTYYLKVTRATGTLNTVKPNYAVQLSMGQNFSQDYDTTESPASPNTLFASTAAQATANVSSILNTLAGGNLFDFLA